MTYAGFAEHFAPLAGQDFADQMAAPPTFVVSTTLESADWGNATVLGADRAERLREIKAGDGPDLGVSGSITLVRSLIALACSTSCTCWCTRSSSGRGSGCSRRAGSRTRCRSRRSPR